MTGGRASSIIEPVTRCVSLIGEEVKVASMLYHAVFAFSKMEQLLEAARQQLRRAGKSDAAVIQLMAANRTLEQWARDLVNDDYQALTVHSRVFREICG